MKRLLALSFILCLFVEGLYPKAGELNIYASGLRVNSVNEETNEVSINYFLNCDADALEFQLINSTGVAKTVAITGSGNLTKGQHNNVTIDLSEVTVGGSYRWAIKATRTSVNNYTPVTDESVKYQFYAGRGVAVDNSFESDYFGRVYVTNNAGTSTMNDKRTTQSGVYVFNSDLSQVNSTAYGGGLTWGGNSGIQWAIARPCVGPDGTVYIASGSATNSGVWMMDPANPTTFTPVFGGTHSATGTTKQGETIIHNSVLHCYVEGDGDSRILYTYDLTTASNGGDIFRYDIGTLASPWTAAPSATIYNDEANGNKIQGGDCSIAPDGNGGWWICQYRSGTGSTAVPCLIHTTNGTIDYNSGTTITSSQQGGLAVSVDGKVLAIGKTKSNIAIYDVTYDANNKPTITQRSFGTIPWGSERNAKGLAFDVANNLYAIDNNKEMFAAWATHGAGHFTTPAPSSQKISISRPLAGTYKIGGDDANYTSLHAATKDINKCGISADVNLLICANLTEPVNPVLTNGTEYSITIRPDADADRKISFTATADNYGPSGAFVIGGVREIISGVDTIAWNTSLTNNIHINGYAEDGTTRRLIFDTPSGHDNTYPILIYGNVHDSYIKNCIINCTKASGTRAGIIVRTAKNTNTAPQNILIENNLINPSSIAGQGILFNGSQATTKGVGAPKDCIIRNNRIEVQNKGIYINGANGLTIENNDIQIAGANGMNSHAIMGDQYNRGDIIIRNNKFNLTTNNAYDNDYGVIGIASSGLAAGQTIQWTIENNYFGGLDAKNAYASSKKFKMMYVRCANPTIVRHNTFHIPAFTKSVGMDLVSGYCAAAVYLASSSEYIVQNNIFVCEETSSKVSLIRGALNTNIKNNIFYHAGGNGAMVAGGTIYNTYNDLPEIYRTTYNNKNIHVEFSDGYRFTDEYANNINLGVEHIANFNYDIEGNTRNTPTRAGCYDPAWSITLDQTANNDAVLTDFDNILVDATLKRPFIADGGWYTLVLPFDVTAGQLAEAFGAGTEVAVLQNSRWKSADEMYLNFQKQATIEAGVPCLIKPTETIASEVTFHDVTIDNELTEIETDLVNMIGFYKPTTITLDDDNYYLGNSNLLYEYNTEYASSYATPNGFRAYFHFDFTPPAGCAARVVFHEDTTTGIEESPETQAPAATKVIREGQLLIIRDGKEYNVQGQLVR